MKVQEHQNRRYIRFPNDLWEDLSWDPGTTLTFESDGPGRLLVREKGEEGPGGYTLQSNQTLSLSKELSDFVGIGPGDEVQLQLEVGDNGIEHYLEKEGLED